MKKLLTVLALLAGSTLASAAETTPVPSVSVSGSGKVFYVPDLGYISAGVSSEGWTAAEAWKKNHEIVRKIFERLKQLGIDEKDIKTGNLGLQPRYSQKPKQEPRFVGYTASYELTVTSRKLDQMGAILDALVDSGANRNMNISFGCSKMDQLIEEARVKAVSDARKRASLYVTGAGARLGDVLGISDTPYAVPQHFYPVDALAVREAKASLPVSAGEQEMTVTVTITWAIDNHRLEG
jgi:uncharacterized protein YggE